MKKMNKFLTCLGNDKILLDLFGGLIVTGGTLVTLVAAAVVWSF